MTIAELLREARATKGVSQRAAARDLGCSEMTFRMWERGVWQPGAERAKAIAAWSGLSKTKVLTIMGILEPSEAKAVREQAPSYKPKRIYSQAERRDALKRIQAEFAKIPPEIDLVAELIAERREEARREAEEP